MSTSHLTISFGPAITRTLFSYSSFQPQSSTATKNCYAAQIPSRNSFSMLSSEMVGCGFEIHGYIFADLYLVLLLSEILILKTVNWIKMCNREPLCWLMDYACCSYRTLFSQQVGRSIGMDTLQWLLHLITSGWITEFIHQENKPFKKKV